MTAVCWPSVRGRRLRATRLDECGAPDPGPCGQVVTKGFISIAFSPEVEEGEEITVRNAGGDMCISDQGCPTLKWISIEGTFCNVDPDLFSLLTGYEVVLDHAGASVGNRISSEVRCDGGAALELWSDIPGQTCSVTGAKQYGYFLLPWMVNGIIGDFTIENDAANFVISGRTQVGSLWGVGPYDVDAEDVNNTAGPLLTPIGPEDHLDMHVTTIAPPAAACGCTALTIPAGGGG